MKHLRAMAQAVTEAAAKFNPAKHDVEYLHKAVGVAGDAYNTLFRLREEIYREIDRKEESGK